MNTTTNGTKPLIECRNLKVDYGSWNACRDVSFSIFEGNYICIVGANGSGKTTLVKTILGLKQASSGEIIRNGLKAGYLPQQNSIQKDFPASVREVVQSGCISSRHLFYNKADRQKAREVMEKLGIADISEKSYMELSGGQQQRVLLARALCSAGNMLILDEPVTGLDPVVTDELYSLIRELNHKDHMAVLMVSHDIHRAVQNATHILHMDRTPLFFGTSEEYRHTEHYSSMSHVEVCSTHLCTHCGPGCNATHIHLQEKQK